MKKEQEFLKEQYENLALENKDFVIDLDYDQLLEINEPKTEDFQIEKPKSTSKAKTTLKPEKTDNGMRLTFRLYDEGDILKFKSFQKQLEGKGQSISNALADIIITFLDEKEKKKVMSSLKVDMFYAFRKAFYASMTPYTANIINQTLKIRSENNIINKKLDLLLNALAGGDITKETINNPSSEILSEPKYFAQIRQLLKVESENNEVKINEKVARIQERQKIYEEYEFSNESDPQILAEYLDENQKN